jgi:hypothetical protein
MQRVLQGASGRWAKKSKVQARRREILERWRQARTELCVDAAELATRLTGDANAVKRGRGAGESADALLAERLGAVRLAFVLAELEPSYIGPGQDVMRIGLHLSMSPALKSLGPPSPSVSHLPRGRPKHFRRRT